MTPEEIGSRFAALLGAGDALDAEAGPRAVAQTDVEAAGTADVASVSGPLDAPPAAAADVVSEREREVADTPRTDVAGGPIEVAGPSGSAGAVDADRDVRIQRREPPAAGAEGGEGTGGDERAERVRRAQEERAARAADAGEQGGGPAGGDERVRRAQEARAARAADAGEQGGGPAGGDERAERVRRAQEARAARAAAAGGQGGEGTGGDERAERVRRAQEARAARGRPAATAAGRDTGVRTVGDLGLSVSGGADHARATIDVPPARWAEAIRAARDDRDLAYDFFDWLSAVDELDDGFAVVAHLWSTTKKHGVLVRTRIPRATPTVDTIIDIYPGAAWHERETHEMFGIDFAGHPNLRPLLLPPEFEGHPLRKEFVLASRAAKSWPGAKEPGESESGAAKRAPMRPPGVPAPGEWGPA